MDFAHYAPHGYCIAWDTRLLWTFVLGNLLVAISYITIPIGLLMIIKKRKDIAFEGIFVLFSAFIFCCAITHIIKIWTFWHPDYWAEAIADGVTGLVSVASAIALFRIIPQLVSLPNPKEYYRLKNQHEKNKILQTLARELPSPIWSCDSKGQMLYVNKEWLEFTGSKRKENKDNNWIHYFYKDDQKKLEELFSGKYQTEDEIQESFEARLRSKDDSYFRFWCQVESLRDKDSPDDRVWFGCMTNIENQKLLEEKLEKEVEDRTKEISDLNDSLRQTNKDLEQFKYIAAHDLREPLRVVRGFSDLLKESMDDQSTEQEEFFGFINGAAEKMQLLIDDLLSLSRIGKQSSESLGTCDLKECIKSCLDNLSMQIEEADAEITVEDLPPVIAKKEHMVQMFQNLISNSIKFRSVDKPKIKITAQTENNHAIISIQDNGIGIEKEYQDLIFKPFKRLNVNDEIEGSGIGLAIVEKIVDVNHGEVWIESEKGKGTKFFAKLLKSNNREKNG